jgi:hypothetical protein
MNSATLNSEDIDSAEQDVLLIVSPLTTPAMSNLENDITFPVIAFPKLGITPNSAFNSRHQNRKLHSRYGVPK